MDESTRAQRPPSRPQPAAPGDVRVDARSLAYLYAIGATLVVVTVAFHHARGQRDGALYAIAGVAYVAALVLRLAGRWLPAWTYEALVALGTALVTLGIDFSHDGASPYAAFYVWVAVYSFYFFSRARATLQVLFAGLAYGLVLAYGPHAPAPVARWLLTLGTSAVAGRLVAMLVDQARARAAEAGARAERSLQHAEDITRIADVARDLASVTDAHAARPAICKAACELASAKVALLFEPDPRGQELVSTAIVGAQSEQIHLPFTGPPTGAGTAFSSGEPHFVSDAPHHPGVAQHVREKFGVESALWQPVIRNNVPIGVLALAWGERVTAVSDRVRSLINLLAAEAAAAIERADLLARLEAVARTDDLTGLANRRAWDEHLPRELARAMRDERPLCVAMLDLDNFKDYNDERGHQAGDRLLKQITATWRELLRPSDLLARYGGEEFGLVLPNCPLEQAVEVIERLRACMIAGQTCSAGVAAWDGREAPEPLVSRADAALYEAKKAGRDCAIAAR
jgi:diguanylate cyclase (GGDEF)-like protein